MIVGMSIQGMAMGAGIGAVVSLYKHKGKINIDHMMKEAIQTAFLGLAAAFLRVQYTKAVAVGSIFGTALLPIAYVHWTKSNQDNSDLFHIRFVALLGGAIAAGLLESLM